MNHGVVSLGLATHTGADARQRLASSGRDTVATIFTLIAALASGHAGSSGAECVVDCIIDLILHRTIACPSTGHVDFLCASPEARSGDVGCMIQSSAWPKSELPRLPSMLAPSASCQYQ